MIEAIKTFTNPSATAGVTLSDIPSTYKHLMLVTNLKASTGNSDVGIVANGDTGTNYSYMMFYGNSTGGKNPYRTTRASYQITNWSYPDSSVFTTAVTYFHNYSNPNLWKVLNSRSVRGNSGGGVDVGQSHWFSTATINSLYIFGFPNSFAAGCTFSLYGIV
jgi:hypothetical protein